MGRIFKWRDSEAAGFFQESRRIIAAGGILALPTETFYALAADPFQTEALKKLFALKSRHEGKPVLLLVADGEMARQVARQVPELAARLMERFWPGPLTLILPARDDLPELVTGGTGTVGIRQPRQDFTCRLLAELGLPLTGTSANRAGREPLTLAAELDREFNKDEVDLILDTGPCPGGLPSTIVDLTTAPPRLVRAGSVAEEDLLDIIPDLSWRR